MPRTAVRGVALALAFILAACSVPGSTPSPSASPIGTPAGTPAPTPTGTPSPELSPSPTVSPTADASPAATPTDGAFAGTTYVVQRGDGLFAIARSYGTSVEQLQAWNSGRYPSLATDPNVIEPGWELVVSLEPGITPRPTPSPPPASTPRPTPPPASAGCTAGNRVPAGSPQTFRTIPGAGPAVALTFDMGGRMDPAVDIMNFLVANRVCATIFATGAMSETPQGRQVLAIIRDHPHLFEIANHTMYHCDLVRGGGGSPSTRPCQGSFDADRIRAEMTDAEAILRAGTGQDPRPYWRPPYGSVSQAVIDAVASVGYTKTFLWDIDTIDWKPVSDGGPTAQQIAARVVGNSVNGSNVLFHLGGYETLAALRLIVPGLRDRGFTLTSLSDLLN
jgi:peptidoglycan/xylan/chitin deacetylase (PgdA/CDA1 family)/LysM repeat protein